MRHIRLALTSALICFTGFGVVRATAATQCVYDHQTQTGQGCAENFKCSPLGVCEPAFTAAEIVDVMAPFPRLPVGFAPPPIFSCDGSNGWGKVGDACLPTCETLATMWAENLKKSKIDPNKGDRDRTSYIRNKKTCDDRPNTFNGIGCAQGPITAVYVPKNISDQGLVCCGKFCADSIGGRPDPSPPDYTKFLSPNLGDPEAPPVAAPPRSPPVRLGPPIDAETGRPLTMEPNPMKK
jgi:hypothetical protein